MAEVTEADWEYLDLEGLHEHLADVIHRDNEDDYLYIADLEDYIENFGFHIRKSEVLAILEKAGE